MEINIWPDYVLWNWGKGNFKMVHEIGTTSKDKINAFGGKKLAILEHFTPIYLVLSINNK